MIESEDRILLYRLLSRVFAYPDLERLAEIAELSQGLPEAAPLLAGLKTPLTELQAEYTGLFINGYPELPCPPYESAYREGGLLGEAAAEVAQFYERWGLEASVELPDHLALELEFLYFLNARAGEAEDPEEATRAHADCRRFLKEHLFQWAPEFAKDLQERAQLRLYREAASLLTRLLALEGAGL